MGHELYRSYTLVVEPLTPIHVSGFSVKPEIDIVLESDGNDKYWCLIDIEDIGALSNDEVIKIMSATSYHVIMSIVKEKIISSGKCRYRIKDKSIKNSGISQNEIWLLSRPWLIPASTIKGILRTFILESMILNLDDANIELLLDTIEHEIRNINKTSGIKDIALNTVEKSLLRVLKENKYIDLLQKLQVSEPIVEYGSTYVGESVIVKRNGDIVGTSLVEFIDEGRFSYNIKMFKYPLVECIFKGSAGIVDIVDFLSISNEKLSQIHIDDNTYNILDYIKPVYKHIIEENRTVLAELYKLGEFNDSYKLEDHTKLYGRLEEAMSEPGCIPFKVGRFAGHMWKTIWPALIYKRREHALQVYERLSQLMAKVLERSIWDSLTVKLACRYGKCVEAGWAKLCLRRI